jgi:hypothetical protein
LHTEHPLEPITLYLPAAQMFCVGDGEPAEQLYPAEQSLHADAPAKLYRPPGHIAATGVDVVDAAGHA